MYNIGFGAIYAVVTLLGFVAPNLTFDLLAINMADNFLHLAITVVLLAAGFGIDVPETTHAR
jgi:hypothetical protein